MTRPRDREPSPAPRGSSPRTGRARVLFATAVLAALLGGCVAKEKPIEYPHTNLGGFVTVDDNPIDDAMISFCSKDIQLGQVIVTNVVRGRYIAEKVPLGPVVVVISGVKDTGRKVRPGGPEEVVGIIPDKYRAEFELDVKENSSQVDFRMTTQ